MEPWEKALDEFLVPWKKKKEVVGAIVCGSYVTGNPSKHSDIDVHIILKKGTKWRERGNEIVDGYLIEYFANPPEQIEWYFKDDHKDNSFTAPTMFLTGRILFDDGSIVKLRRKANTLFKKRFEKMGDVGKELSKYSLWDMLDNLRDSYEKEEPDFVFICHNMLNELYRKYAKYSQSIT